MPKHIKQFRGEYSFLSNFFYSPINYNFDDLPFYTHDNIERGKIGAISNEHFFQACKAYSFSDHYRIITSAYPSIAKKRGRKIKIRNDWENIKIDVMRYGLKMKFDQNPDIKQKLIDTRSMFIEEGNKWNDLYWGVDLHSGNGNNVLGKLLMELRREYRKGFTTNIEQMFDDIVDDL